MVQKSDSAIYQKEQMSDF